MTREFSAAQILADRYGIYAEHAPAAKRIDKDELWFFSPAACRRILSTPSMSAERTDLASRLRESGAHELAQFFSNWVMYREGIEHADRRRAAIAALNEIVEIPNLIVEIALPEDGSAFDLVTGFAEPFAWNFMSNAFGVPPELREEWHELVGLVCSVPGLLNPSGDTLRPIEEALLRLRSQVANGPGFRLREWVREASGGRLGPTALTDLVINLLGDGVHPTSAALAAEVYSRCVTDALSGDGRGPFRFHMEAPFQYVARTSREALEIDGIQIGPGTRVVACIGASGRVGTRPLTFGFGRHSCPGRRLAEKCVAAGLECFFHWGRKRELRVNEPEWVASVGYRAMTRCIFHEAPLS